MIDIINVTGKAAFAYVRASLSRGRSLSRSIMDLPIEQGQIFSLVPTGTKEDRLYAFEYGGIYLSNSIENERGHSVVPVRNDARPQLIEQILKRLNSNGDNFCLFEEPIMWPSDTILTMIGIDFVFLGDKQVFYFFDSTNVTKEKVDEAIRVSDDYIFLCTLGSIDSSIRSFFSPSKGITLEHLVSFVKNIDAFFITAYDGEGYLMWIRG